MTISAQILADSVSEEGVRLTSLQLRYPRFIHAEELTHRRLETQPELFDFDYDLVIPDGVMYDQTLSRNASSSRAIPVERLIQDIIDDTAMPIHWGKNQAGMQAREEHRAMVKIPVFDPIERRFIVQDHSSEAAWLRARDAAIEIARAFATAGYHKQIVNRLLEPFSHINVVVTATEWMNFFALRRHEDAQPEIKALADAIWDAMDASEPRLLKEGEWHLPYVEKQDIMDAVDYLRNTIKIMPTNDRIGGVLLKLSVARCASVSYKTVEGAPMTFERATALYDKLVSAIPLHASPAEHQATPDAMRQIPNPNGITRDMVSVWANPQLHGNLVGWKQFRKTLPNENITG